MESLQAQLSLAADQWGRAARPIRDQAARTQTADFGLGVSRVVLRGRADVMAASLAALRRVSARGHGEVILLEGEPGIGKTAVFDEVVEQAARMKVSIAVSKA